VEGHEGPTDLRNDPDTPTSPAYRTIVWVEADFTAPIKVPF
jgi:hypothetical protein